MEKFTKKLKKMKKNQVIYSFGPMMVKRNYQKVGTAFLNYDLVGSKMKRRLRVTLQIKDRFDHRRIISEYQVQIPLYAISMLFNRIKERSKISYPSSLRRDGVFVDFTKGETYKEKLEELNWKKKQDRLRLKVKQKEKKITQKK